MKVNIRAVFAAAVVAAVLSGVMFGQATADAKDPTNSRGSCSTNVGFGRRIESSLDIVEFRVPRFASLTKVNDSDYLVYRIRRATHPQDSRQAPFRGPTGRATRTAR